MMTREERLAEIVRAALKPRLIRTVPAGEMNEGASEWEQPGAEEVAAALAPLVTLNSEMEHVGYYGAVLLPLAAIPHDAENQRRFFSGTRPVFAVRIGDV